MVTVLESIKLSTSYFEKKGIESPRVNAEILLAHVLKCKRLDLYMAFDKPLKEKELATYRETIKRRATFEPLQYIVGSVEFYGLPFQVDRSVLIPRPETEILVESIINAFPKDNCFNILDIGTGTGNIPISLAKYLPQSHFTSIDISRDALKLAKQNAADNSVSDRIVFLHKDILSTETEFENKFDIIVSNPPYVPVNEYPTLQAEIIRFEPREAVTDENDGLTFYKSISGKAELLLNENGYLFFEVGKGQAGCVYEIMEADNYKNIKIIKDYLNIERVICGVKS
ncbi:MAG: peptide chain release factor N(5)-glutamine methyltransferase [Ignavibacteria bacterium]